MPADSTVAYGTTNHEERSRQSLIQQAKTINARGHEVLEEQRRATALAASVAELEACNPDLLKLHSSTIVKYIVFLFGLLCVYGIDVLLFGATAEYVASMITGVDFLVTVAKYGTPLFFLGIEVLISLKIVEAREEVNNYGW